MKRVLILIIFKVLFSIGVFLNRTDLTKCKLTHLGLTYAGDIDKTESGIRCQSWTASNPIHKMDNRITSEMFPEKSKGKANSYCRNPLRREDGPWCYSMDKELSDDTCGIPLCSFIECRLTGPGMEYGGNNSHTISGQPCLTWDKHRKKVLNTTGDYYEQEKFSKRRFPDESRSDAEKFCRNPDGDSGGPWCFVKGEKGTVEKQYCNIPFCYEETCVTFTRKSSIYSHYTFINESITNLTFGIKVWNPDNVEPSATLILSLFALPLNEEEINDLKIAIGVHITNKESALHIGSKGSPEYEPTQNILTSEKFIYFSLMWNSGFVTLHVKGKKDAIFLAEYRWKDKLFNLNRNRFFYYNIQGSNVLWSLPFCDKENFCEMHTTTSDNFERFWPLRHTNSSYDVQFHIRAFHSATLLFLSSPAVPYPRIKLYLGFKMDNSTKIILYTHENSAEVELKRTIVLKFLNFWDWRKITITIFQNTMQVYWNREVGTLLVLEVKHPRIANLKWYSPGSEDSVALWSFFCPAQDLIAPPPPWPPECVVNKDERTYEGTQSVTSLGHPCLPWTYDDNLETKLALENWNYCRDPLKELQGTFCHVVSQKSSPKYKKEFCGLRLCRSSECRMAGTGNDYIGTLNTTRSNRTCQYWTVNEPHFVNKTFLNGSLYADQDIKLVKNYCRDPSRNLVGSYCYTTDKRVVRDICNVRDCVHAEECIIMTKGNGTGRYIYILPEWKEGGIDGGLHFALKEWDPDLLDGIIFEITSLDDKPGFIKLIIGAESNERVLLYYSSTNSKNAKLVKEKTLPHLIPAGAWAAFWLQMRRGEIMLGYEGTFDPLFVWTHSNIKEAFEPGFMTYMSIQGNAIGVHFKCTECHTERTSTQFLTRVMPLRLWSTEETTNYSNLSIYARGTGILLIPLLLIPGENLDYYGFAIGDYNEYVMYVLNTKTTAKALVAKKLKPVLVPDVWTHFLFIFGENDLEVIKDNVTIMKYHTENVMLYYFFTITVESGWVTWAANCEPPDIDGPPRNGGWSEWSAWKCTVSCGGGTGVRYRTCSNPRPNIRGKLCQGSYSDTGICNDFKCGDISPQTMETIQKRLRSPPKTFYVNEGEEFIIENDKIILEMIRKESPKAFYEWTFNGVFVEPKQNIIELVNDDLVIKSAKKFQHSGLYSCILFRIDGQRIVLTIHSVVVVSKNPDILTRATLDLTLTCNAAVLGYIYTDLSQLWLLNNQIIIDYGITTLAAHVMEKISPLNLSHSGNWTCRVSQDDLKLNWDVNLIQVRVRTAPTWITHLMEDEFTKPIFGYFESQTAVVILLIIIIVIVCVLVFIGLFLYLKYGVLPKRQYKRLVNSFCALIHY